ncbi:hypothetical protein [Asanoa sp. NPDC050611]|uniref:hypothetical protein n=1 Tax=Asanoa sp. NPDC050611 TaxID=3157098 RepID=UPI0033DEFDE2
MDCADLQWSPLLSAPAHSQLAGVLAGLVFAGMIVLFGAKRPSPARTRALVLFAGALVALAVDSFIFGVVAGETVCVKAWTETMPAAGLLGLGALGIFGGISWLFSSYDPENPRVTALANLITYVVAVIVGYHLQVTASSYLVDLQDSNLNEPPGWLFDLVGAYAWGILVLVLAVPLWRAVRRRRGALRTPSALRDREARLDNSAIMAAQLSLLWVLLVALMSGTLLSKSAGWTPRTSDAVVIASTVLSLAVPTLGLIAQLQALPETIKSRPRQAKVPRPLAWHLPRWGRRRPGAAQAATPPLPGGGVTP